MRNGNKFFESEIEHTLEHGNHAMTIYIVSDTDETLGHASLGETHMIVPSASHDNGFTLAELAEYFRDRGAKIEKYHVDAKRSFLTFDSDEVETCDFHVRDMLFVDFTLSTWMK